MISDDSGYVAIHDAARPLVTPEMISEVISEAKKRGAATLASPVIDTIKIINNV
jgi:2-C-methyl-D-erythritol 4-phosphate cytidylyltransferase